MEATLSEAFTYLVSARQRSFCARLISSLIRQERPGMGTFAVGVSPEGKYVFFYDPELLKKMSLMELMLVCEHEVYHLLLHHIPRYLSILSGLVDKQELAKFRAVMNVSADLAANELSRSESGFDKKYGEYFYGSEKTEGRSFLIPETFELAREQAFEIYLFQLLKKMKTSTAKMGDLEFTVHSVPLKGKGKGKGKGKDKGDGEGEGKDENQDEGEGQSEGDRVAVLDAYFQGKTGGSHQFWEKELEGLSSEEKQGLADRLEGELRTIVDKTIHGSKSRGTIPASMEELIQKLLTPPTIPWPQVLRNFCMRTRETKISRGMTRPSRRMHGVPGILPFPGKARDRKFTITFALDTSGSMSSEDLALGFKQLLDIAKSEEDVHVVVMYCDADIHAVYDVTSADQVDFKAVGRGGTDFNPIFIRTREMLQSDRGSDILIIATDGYAPAPNIENRVPMPVIWLITPRGTEPSPGYGTHIRMEPF
jgi:predicted metal-dependent peptidase